MSNRYRNKINRFRSKAVKRWLGMGIASGDYEFYMPVDVGREADAAIATLTAERDELKKQVRELVDAVESADKVAGDHYSGFRCVGCGAKQYEDCDSGCMFTLAAQLKEQDDAA